MNKSDLIILAQQIKQPSRDSGYEMLKNMQYFTDDLNKYMSNRKDTIELIGKDNIELMQTNHENHFKYISSLALLYDPKSFVETIIWVIRTYISHGFSTKYWDVMLPKCIEISKEYLSANSCDEIINLYQFIHSNFNLFLEVANATPSFYENIDAAIKEIS